VDIEEGAFTHFPLCHDSAGNADYILFDLSGLFLFKQGYCFNGCVAALVTVGIRVNTKRPDAVKFFLSLLIWHERERDCVPLKSAVCRKCSSQ